MESQYYRTFIGLPLRVEPPFLKARRDLIRSFEGERISWTNPEQYHVTLRFIGDTDLSSVERIGSELQAGISVPAPLRLDAGNLDSFGPRKKPRVIWVGFEESVFFESLKSEVDRVLQGCGIPVTEQPFRAHLTLGRVRKLHDLRNYYDTLDAMGRKFCSPVLFEKLVFFRSILGPGGPEYRVLNEILFKHEIKPF